MLIGADRGTRCKIAAVALAGALTLVMVGITARVAERDVAIEVGLANLGSLAEK